MEQGEEDRGQRSPTTHHVGVTPYSGRPLGKKWDMRQSHLEHPFLLSPTTNLRLFLKTTAVLEKPRALEEEPLPCLLSAEWATSE